MRHVTRSMRLLLKARRASRLEARVKRMEDKLAKNREALDSLIRQHRSSVERLDIAIREFYRCAPRHKESEVSNVILDRDSMPVLNRDVPSF